MSKSQYAKLFGASLPVVTVVSVGGARNMIAADSCVSGEFYERSNAPEDWGVRVFCVAPEQRGGVDGMLDVVSVREIAAPAMHSADMHDGIDL
jgi:hypothetical protein